MGDTDALVESAISIDIAAQPDFRTASGFLRSVFNGLEQGVLAIFCKPRRFAFRAPGPAWLSAPQVELLIAQCFTAVGRYEDAALVLRQFLKAECQQSRMRPDRQASGWTVWPPMEKSTRSALLPRICRRITK